MPIEKLAFELSKVDFLKVKPQKLAKILETEPVFASLILAAVKMDEDVKKGLIPAEFGDIDAVSERFGSFFSQGIKSAKVSNEAKSKSDFEVIDLPTFTKYVLINMVKMALSEEKTENLK